MHTRTVYEDVCLLSGGAVPARLRLCISHEDWTVHMCECYLCISSLSSLSQTVSAPDVLGSKQSCPPRSRCVQVWPAVSRMLAHMQAGLLSDPQTGHRVGDTFPETLNVWEEHEEETTVWTCVCPVNQYVLLMHRSEMVWTKMNEHHRLGWNNQATHLSVTIFGRMWPSVQLGQLCPLISSARRTGPSLRTEIWQFYNRKRALESYILWHGERKEGETDRNRQSGFSGLKEIWNEGFFSCMGWSQRGGVMMRDRSVCGFAFRVASEVCGGKEKERGKISLLSSSTVYADSSSLIASANKLLAKSTCCWTRPKMTFCLYEHIHTHTLNIHRRTHMTYTHRPAVPYIQHNYKHWALVGPKKNKSLLLSGLASIEEHKHEVSILFCEAKHTILRSLKKKSQICTHGI